MSFLPRNQTNTNRSRKIFLPLGRTCFRILSRQLENFSVFCKVFSQIVFRNMIAPLNRYQLRHPARARAPLPLVSFAAVFWDVTQSSTQRNGCSHPNNIPFHCLANQSFRSIFENPVAPNSPFETCPIRDHFLFSHHTMGKSQINMATSARLEEAFHLASSKFKIAV